MPFRTALNRDLIIPFLVLLCLPAVVAVAEEGMQYPIAAAVSSDGTIYVADRDLPGVWKFSEGRWSIYFQASKKFRTPLNAIRCLAMDAQGKLLAGDPATREIYRFDDTGQPQPLTKGGIGIPMALAVAKEGTIYVADLESHRILKIPAAGGVPTEVVELGATRGLCLDRDGNLIAVTHGRDAVIRITADGKEKTVLVKGRPFQFSHHVAIGSKGELYIADGYAKTIWKVEENGTPTPFVVGEPLKNPVGLAISGEDLLIVDPHVKAVLKRTSDGTLVRLGDQPEK